MPPKQVSFSEDALDRLLEGMGSISNEVKDLAKKLEEVQRDQRIANYVGKEMGKAQAAMAKTMEDLADRVDIAERNIRRHDSGFARTTDADMSHESKMAALVIAIEDTRKLAKESIALASANQKTQDKVATETAAQTPVLAQIEKKVDDQTKTFATPAKIAAGVNFVIGMVYLIIEILKQVHH